jgi:hypothetical protein
VNSPGPGLRQPGFDRRKLCRTDDLRPHAVFGRKRLGDQRRVVQSGLGAVQGMIPSSLHEIVRAGLADQHAMLACCLCDDPCVGL